MKKSWIIACLTVVASLSLLTPSVYAKTKNKAQETPFAGVYGLPQIVADMNRKASAGVVVRSITSGKILYTKDAEQFFAPASNMKVITAYVGLKFLGPDFVYRTKLLTDAPNLKPNDGILRGNLYLEYSGDPTLQYSDLNALFRELAQDGIRQVQGNLYVDTSLYDTQGISPGTENTDTAYCYGAPVSAAILNRNCVTFKLLPGVAGSLARLSFPYDVALPVNNSVMTSSSRACRLSIKKSEDGHLVLAGCISPRRTAMAFTMTIPADSQYGQKAAAQCLVRSGIRVLGTDLPTHPKAQSQIIAEHDSKPLASLVVEMMKKSDNLIANTIFKSVGAAYNKQSATWQNSGAAEKAILQKNGIDVTGMQIIDGSGLSRDNRVSPMQLSQVLIAAYKDPIVSPVYLKALPVGGLNGTLKYRLGSRDIIGKVKAKTGSMHGVSSLSGYVETRSGEIIAFSIIVNDFVGGLYPYRMMEDKLCRVLRANY